MPSTAFTVTVGMKQRQRVHQPSQAVDVHKEQILKKGTFIGEMLPGIKRSYRRNTTCYGLGAKPENPGELPNVAA